MFFSECVKWFSPLLVLKTGQILNGLGADNGGGFMRWKEHFLVPDHRIVSIPGASFAGFYYCVYERAVSAPLCAPASPRASRRQGS